MAYVKTNWEDYPSTATAIDADALNHMEEGIYNNDQALGGKLDNASPSFSGNMTGSGNVTVGGEVENGNGETLHGAYQSAENVLPIDTESGNPTVITDAFGGSCKSLVLTLEPIQSGSGTPSPSNVRPISGRTQSVVKRTGLNILPFPYTATSGTVSGVTFTVNNDGTVKVNGTATADIDYTLESFIFPDNTRYKFMGCPSGGSVNSYFMQIRGTDFLDVGNGFISNDSIASRNVQIRIKSGTACNNLLFKPMITPDLTATEYAPYNGASSSITRTYGTTIYGGTDDITGDEAISKLKCIKGNTLNWTQYTMTGNCVYYSDVVADIKRPSSNAETIDLTCSHYVKNTWNWLYQAGHTGIAVSDQGRIAIADVDITTLSDFETMVANIDICYELATPTSIPLTAQNITLLHGDNVITTDADSIEASYSADIALYIAKKIAEGSQGNRNLSKGGSGDEEGTEEEKKEEDPKEVEVNER